MVRQSPYSFGYVELIYAVQNKMSFGSVKNASGKFVKASTEGVTAAAAAAAKTMPADYRVSITNAPGCGVVSDLQLHLAADSEARNRSGEDEGHEGFSGMDARPWRERGLGA